MLDQLYIELIGTAFGLLCIYFASIEKTINYLFGLLNVSVFAIIFFHINLYASLLLQIFFFSANLYGWYAWTRINKETKQVTLKTRWMSPLKWVLWLFISIISIALLTEYIDLVFATLTTFTVETLNAIGVDLQMPILTPDPFPFWDSTILVLSIVAQILMTRKYVENWILWVIINLISVNLFIQQGVYAMAIQYVILIFIAINGIRLWSQSAKLNKAGESKID